MVLKLMLAGFLLAALVAGVTPKGCVHCIIESCGPCDTRCEADQFSYECESCIPSCVECISDCKVS